MSEPHDVAPDDRQLERYILGLLPEEESERLDRASIEDDLVASRLRVIEQDLIDGYVRRTIDPATRVRFELHYLASPRRREKVRVAECFLRAIDRAAERSAAETSDAIVHDTAHTVDDDSATDLWGSPPVKQQSGSTLVWRLWPVAASLCICTGLLLLQIRRDDRLMGRAPDPMVAGERAHLSSRTASGPTTPDAAPPSTQQPVEHKAVWGPFVRPMETGSAPPRQPTREPSRFTGRDAEPRTPPPIPALVLAPQTRGIGPFPAIAVSASDGTVMLELRLESNDFPRYQVGLRDPAVNRIVWRSDWIPPTSEGDRASIRLMIPASLLKVQHYTLDLNRPPGDGAEDVIGSYAFEVVPQ